MADCHAGCARDQVFVANEDSDFGRLLRILGTVGYRLVTVTDRDVFRQLRPIVKLWIRFFERNIFADRN